MVVRSLPLLAVLALSGCYVSSHKSGKNVDIGTPFGSMHVKTDPSIVVAGLGLTVYPGAVPLKQDNKKDNDSADLNLSFGDFHLGVKEASYMTPDSLDKVEAFYRKDLARYGDVIKCSGETTIGQPTRTQQGLTCKDEDSDDKKTIHVSESGAKSNPELRAGSPQHQHLVGLETKNGGTKIGLVALDLPAHISVHTDKDSE